MKIEHRHTDVITDVVFQSWYYKTLNKDDYNVLDWGDLVYWQRINTQGVKIDYRVSDRDHAVKIIKSDPSKYSLRELNSKDWEIIKKEFNSIPGDTQDLTIDDKSTNELANPIVFISYSWDDEIHKSWVLNLANDLIENGIDVILDRFYLKPGKNISTFVESSLERANRILVIYTEKYNRKASSREGGVGQEYSIINEILIKDLYENNRVIPLLRSGNSESSIPSIMQPYVYSDFRKDSEYANSLNELVNVIKDTFRNVEDNTKKVDNKSELDDENLPEEKRVSGKGSSIYLREILSNSSSLFHGDKIQRINSKKAIFNIGYLLSVSDIKYLLKDIIVNNNVAGLIAARSFIIHNDVDLGNLGLLKMVFVSSLKAFDSRIRYISLELIQVSKLLLDEFQYEIMQRYRVEDNEKVKKLLEKIIVKNYNFSDELALNSNKADEILKHVEDVKYELAIDELIKERKKTNDDYSDLILLKSKLKRLEKNKLLGVLSFEEVDLELNKIVHAIIQLVNKI